MIRGKSSTSNKSRATRATTVVLLFILILLAVIGLLLWNSSKWQETIPGGSIVETVIQGDTQIALTETNTGRRQLEMQRSSDAETLRILTPETQDVLAFRWAPDQKSVMYSTFAPSESDASQTIISLWLLSLNATTATQLSIPKNNNQIQFAPNQDATQVAITTDTNLYLLDIAADDLQELYTYPRVGAQLSGDIAYVPEPFWADEYSSITIKTRNQNYWETYLTETINVNTTSGETVTIAEGKDIPV